MSPETESRLLAVLEKLERRLAANQAPTLSVAEAAEQLGCRRSKVFALINNGSLQRVKHGKQTHVTAESVHAIIGGCHAR